MLVLRLVQWIYIVDYKASRSFVTWSIYQIEIICVWMGYLEILTYYNALKLFIITNMDKTFNFFKSKLKK